MDIIPSFLGAAPQFPIMEEGSDTLSFSAFSPFDHKLKQNSLAGWTLEANKSSPACLGLCSLGWGCGCKYSMRLSEQHTQVLNWETQTRQESKVAEAIVYCL